MSQRELLDALTTMGWSRDELARRLGLHRNTVSAWATGKAPVPGYAAEYLRLALLAKEMIK